MNYAPIALFIFNRPQHLQRTLESLMKCEEFDASPVYVFGDGPRRPEDNLAVKEARNTAKELLGEKAQYRFAENNNGLAESIISGVSELAEKHGRVIVVEDDLVVSPEFLSFINSSLDRYSDVQQVKQVSGFIFPVSEFDGLDEALFFPLTTTLGWATWKRAWREFDSTATGWRDLMADKELQYRFNLMGAYDYSAMLRSQMLGECDSWGIRWWWSVFKSKGITCFPPQTMVKHIGSDGTGTHGIGFLKRFHRDNIPLRTDSVRFPDTVAVKANRWVQLRRSISRLNGGRIANLTTFLRRMVSS